MEVLAPAQHTDTQTVLGHEMCEVHAKMKAILNEELKLCIVPMYINITASVSIPYMCHMYMRDIFSMQFLC